MSGIATGTALMIGGGLAAGGSIASGIIGSNAAGNAASTQANAADYAAQLQYQASQNALDFQKQQWNQNQQNLAPWLNTGTGALSNLAYMMGITPQTPMQFANPSGGALPAPGGTPGTAPNPTGSPLSTPGSNAALAGPSMNSINSGLNGPGTAMPQGGPAGVTPSAGSLNTGLTTSGTSQLPIGVPRANPVMGGGPSIGSTTGLQSSGGFPSPANSNLGTFGSLMQSYPGGPFTAPTGLTMENDPGYQARLNLGEQAMQQSAAARGNVLTGGTAQGLNQLAQDYASNEYGNVYNRALSTYGTNYNTWSQQQANEFNRLAAIAGVGQTTAGQLGQLGLGTSNAITSNLLGTAANMGQAYQNAGAANASGIVGGANAWSGALNGAGNNISQMLLLQQLMNGGGTNYIGGGSSGNELDYIK